MEVRREWQNIDITLIDSQNKFAVIIENKIDSGEHSGQLKRYQDIVRAHYPEWQTAALFLTPAGELPSEESYVPVSYRLVCRQVEELLLSGRSTIGSEVQLLMTHYLEMLRRHIVDESQAARLAREIYKKHLRALDFIFENRPDRQGELRGFLENLVTALEGMVLDKSNKTFVTFGLEE